MFIKLPNNVNLFYKQIGKGEPLLLLHGNSDSHEGLETLGKSLANDYTVYLIDSRGHGLSSHHDTYISYSDFAEDIDLFIKTLNLKKVNIIGHSDGAIIATLLALKKKTYLNKIILLGLSLNFHQMKSHWQKWILNEYEKTNHHPLIELMLKEPNIKLNELTSIEIPTLVVAASDDILNTSLYEKISQTIPNGELHIVDGEDHASYVINTDKFKNTALGFLKGSK